MHEGNFTEQIVQAILKELETRPGQRVGCVRVRVGEMLHLQAEAVRLHFDMLAKGGPLEGADLELAQVPLKVRCRDCEKEGGVEDHHLPLCSSCGSPNVAILEGKDVFIQSVDLVETPPV